MKDLRNVNKIYSILAGESFSAVPVKKYIHFIYINPNTFIEINQTILHHIIYRKTFMFRTAEVWKLD
jgi:hypothetical protein